MLSTIIMATVPYTNMHQAGVEPGSSSDDLLEFDHSTLIHSATTAGYHSLIFYFDNFTTWQLNFGFGQSVMIMYRETINYAGEGLELGLDYLALPPCFSFLLKSFWTLLEEPLASLLIWINTLYQAPSTLYNKTIVETNKFSSTTRANQNLNKLCRSVITSSHYW